MNRFSLYAASLLLSVLPWVAQAEYALTSTMTMDQDIEMPIFDCPFDFDSGDSMFGELGRVIEENERAQKQEQERSR